MKTQETFKQISGHMSVRCVSNNFIIFTLLKTVKDVFLSMNQAVIRVGGCYESSLVAANISLCTLVEPKSVKKVFKSTGNRLGIGLGTLLLWFPLCSRSLNRGSPEFRAFCYKSGWTNYIGVFY